MKTIQILFPHQLFENHKILETTNDIYLIEEFLFFKQYNFHKQKLAFHRASMKAYEAYLKGLKLKVKYIDCNNKLADIRYFKKEIISKDIKHINCIDPCDDWLEQRLNTLSNICTIHTFENPLFINSKIELTSFFNPKKKFFFQTSFYKQQRKKLNILMVKNQPEGGKWSYDLENRKKYPNKKTPPPIHFPKPSPFWDEAVKYTHQNFPNHPGHLTNERYYPITFQESKTWFYQFLRHRFYDFGIYEDAIVKEYSILNHTVLSPILNVGLISPQHIIKHVILFAKKENIPINSTEGLIRQIIGWREFIRGMYISKGRFSRSRNTFGFKRKIPSSFYNGSTGIEPVDLTIKKVLKTGYCHHIERLMILGNFMLLCEFDPDEVYKWFMELFIDTYDWVMVPNVYGMSMFADGGTFATKPYISGSNYIKKMSNYSGGNWETIWNGLFWRFIDQHQNLFKQNPRTKMMINTLNKMSQEKKESILIIADDFLKDL